MVMAILPRTFPASRCRVASGTWPGGQFRSMRGQRFNRVCLLRHGGMARLFRDSSLCVGATVTVWRVVYCDASSTVSGVGLKPLTISQMPRESSKTATGSAARTAMGDTWE